MSFLGHYPFIHLGPNGIIIKMDYVTIVFKDVKFSELKKKMPRVLERRKNENLVSFCT